MKDWIELPPIDLPPGLLEAAGGDPLVAQALLRRGCTDAVSAHRFIDPAGYTPASPFDLPDMDAAVTCIEETLASGGSILVWGDFDADGQTSTALLVSALRGLGGHVSYHVPVREVESHGIRPQVLQGFLEKGIDLLLTCDTGVSAHEAVLLANAAGVPVIITDHHDLPPSLPPALAVVNPKRLPSESRHPLRELPGVGVAYKLAEALYTRAERAGECERFLDLAALGIVADVAVLAGETRYLLQRGLPVLRQGLRTGLSALCAQAGITPQFLTEEDLGFSLAPRLNALGRLGDANPVIEFLLTNDTGRAQVQALEFESYNARRKLRTSQVYQAALAQLEQDPDRLKAPVLVLDHPEWEGGVLGLVASRLVDRFHRPAVLFNAHPEGRARGSARSVEGIDITAAIAESAAILENYGGHPMAAGLALQSKDLPEFRRLVAQSVAAQAPAGPAHPVLQIDGDLPLADLTFDRLANLERLSPFGHGNPPLVLAARDLRLDGYSYLDRDQEHVSLRVQDAAGQVHKVLWWGGGIFVPDELPSGRFDLAYTARTSYYKGELSLRVELLDYRVVAPVEVAESAPAVVVIDCREELHPLPVLRGLLDKDDIQVWAEAEAVQALKEQGVTARTRLDLSPAEGLVVWTTPASPADLRGAISAVQPAQVWLFGVDPKTGELNAFLTRLAGLVKFTLAHKGGSACLPELAAACAGRESAVRKGLAWMEQRGLVCVQASGKSLTFSQGKGTAQPGLEQASTDLQAVLAETAAYRLHFKRADKDSFL